MFNNGNIPPNALDDKLIAEIQDAYIHGMNRPDIARRFDISWSSADRHTEGLTVIDDSAAPSKLPNAKITQLLMDWPHVV